MQPAVAAAVAAHAGRASAVRAAPGRTPGACTTAGSRREQQQQPRCATNSPHAEADGGAR
eukprot:4853509-Prymnesium_polylepis.1